MQQTSLKAAAQAVLTRNKQSNSYATEGESGMQQTVSQSTPVVALTLSYREEKSLDLRCARCRNLRMSEASIPGEGPRFVWGCSRGHMEHGHMTPELHRLAAPESCVESGDFLPVEKWVTGRGGSNHWNVSE